MIELFSYSLSFSTLALLFCVAFLIGMAKTGVHGMSMFTVPLLAIIFGGKSSSGLMLPMLIMADIFAVKYYHQHANWSYLVKLFPSAAVGVIFGTWLGNFIDDDTFKLLMSLFIFGSLGIMLWMEKFNKESVPDYLWFALLMGFLGGVTTMIGNLAGSVMALYLLSMRLPKNVYIGTAAWFFLVVNVFKLPFHIVVWESIDTESFMLNLICLPFIGLGAWVGIEVIKKIPEVYYRWLVILMTAIAAILLAI